ncbi:TRAP transporter small permease [Tistrella mobilis]|uniref:TRAP transporter small permease n=1 Tax=Tistrella mobilis TaxID=171437 RepID=UPI001650FCE3|nr:TRAP transporter small permease [Tistrella mobilis]
MPDRACRIGELAAATVIGLMTLHIGLDVAALALSGTPLRGTAEIVSELYMPFVVFGGLAAVQYAGDEIRVDIIDGILSQPLRRGLEKLTQLIVALAAGALAWQTSLQALDALKQGEHLVIGTMRIITWPGKAAIPAAFAMLALASIDRMRRS